jgi:hypothetical protein
MNGNPTNGGTMIDERYTPERIAGYTDEELATHLEERRGQVARAARDLTVQHAALETAEEDTPAYMEILNTISQLTREHAVERRKVSLLERALERARPADARRPRLELVDRLIADQGLFVTLEEAGETEMAKHLWFSATMALESSEETEPSNGEVAQRVADTYATLYFGKAPVEIGLDADDAAAMREYLRDAADEAEREGRAGDWTTVVCRSIDAQLPRAIRSAQ